MFSAIRPERGPDAPPHSARDRIATRPAGDVPAQAPPLVADQVRHQRVPPQCRERPLESPSPPPDRRSSSANRHCDDRDRLYDRRQFRPDPMGDNRRLRSLHCGFRAFAAAAIAAAGEALARKADRPQWPRRRRAAPLVGFVDVMPSLDLLSPPQRAVDAAALGGSTSGTIEGGLVGAGRGFPQEFPSGTTGSVVLIERGDITFSEKVANATAAGAAGVIIYNNDSGSFTGQLTAGSRIPAAAISREDGQALLDLIKAGTTTVRLTVETRTDTNQSQNVVAKPPGKQCRLVVGGHYDSVPAGPGANDNASGTATAIEMARAMAADGVFDPVCFVLFGSEELGLLGSAAYLRSLSPDDTAALKAMLNFDMLAVGDAWPFGGSQSVVSVAAQEADRLSIPHSVDTRFGTGGSDHASFISDGIPAMIFNCFCDPNYHSAGDRFEFVSEARLAQAGALGMATAQALLAE